MLIISQKQKKKDAKSIRNMKVSNAFPIKKKVFMYLV